MSKSKADNKATLIAAEVPVEQPGGTSECRLTSKERWLGKFIISMQVWSSGCLSCFAMDVFMVYLLPKFSRLRINSG